MKAVLVFLALLVACVAGLPVSKKGNVFLKRNIPIPVPFRGLKPKQYVPPKEPKPAPEIPKPKPEPVILPKEPRVPKPKPEPVILPKEPRGVREVAEAAFAASVESDQIGDAGDDSWVNLNFNDIRTQRPEGVYSGGIFLAPVSGYYTFNVGCTSALYRHIGIRMNINTTPVAYGFDNYADYSSGSTSLSYVAFLAKDAEVEVQWNNRNQYGIRGGGYCIFSGSYIGSDA